MLIESVQNLGLKLDYNCINYGTLNEMGILTNPRNEFDIILTKLIEKNHIYFFLVIPIKNCLSGGYRFSADRIRYLPDEGNENNNNEVQDLNNFYEFCNQLNASFNENSSLAHEILHLSNIEMSGEMGAKTYLYKIHNSQVKISVVPCMLCVNTPQVVISERMIHLNPKLNLALKERIDIPFPYFASCKYIFLDRKYYF
jgi:hypothetical protein